MSRRVVAAWFLLLTACPGELAEPESYAWQGACPLDAWKDVVRPRCGGGGCHSPRLSSHGPKPGAGFVLTEDDSGVSSVGELASTCAALGQHTLRIDPVDVEASYLLTVTRGETPPCGPAMPPSGRLSPVEQRCLEAWVRDAAKKANP